MRTNPKSGAIERPWRQRDREHNDMFVLGDPAFGAERHHKDNAVFVSSYSEALELVRRGFSIRMSDGRHAPVLVSPSSLEFVDEPVDRLEDLWTYTMPELPFTLDDVLADLRDHLLSQAYDIAATSDNEAASAFLGVPFDRWDREEVSRDFDLERFNVTRIVRRAYETAFRPWPSDPIDDDDVDELEQIIVGGLVKFGRRDPSPLDDESSPLHRTLLAAYHRWQIADGGFLSGDTLDQSATEAIGVLTGMPASAVRNALSRDGISLVKSKFDYPALLEWLVTRRNFVPLREDEKASGRWTWSMIHYFKKLPIEEALAEIRQRNPSATAGLAAAEAAILKRRLNGEMPTDQELRSYADAIGLQSDRLILELSNLWISA